MNIIESFRISIAGLMSNRLRSILTMLGIIIGVGAVIALVSFGEGFQNYINKTFRSLGANLIFVMSVSPTGPNAKTLKPKMLTMDDAQAIANPMYVPGVAVTTPVYLAIGKVVAGNNDIGISIIGTNPDYPLVQERAIGSGRFFDESDMATSARVAVLGTSTVKKLFDPGVDPVGEEIKINNIPFHVIGVLKSKGGSMFGDEDMAVMVPITTVQTRIDQAASRTANGKYIVHVVFVKTISDKNMLAVKRSIEDLLTDRHKIEFQGEEDFQVITLEQILSILGGIMALLTTFLAVIAGISLIVGGIGVMNIMLVSVTERTREIGLRKAVGARYGDLMVQFLLESIMLCLLGGIIGILLGEVAAIVANALIPDLTLTVTPAAVLLATGVSTAIGVFFGLYPASRAAALSPIEALRYE